MLKGLCMGLSAAFLLTPTPSRSARARARLDRTHDGLPARMHMDVLDRDLLLTLAPVPVQGLQQGDVGAGELVGLGEALLSALKSLVRDHGAPVALHSGTVRRDHLGSQHALQLVS